MAAQVEPFPNLEQHVAEATLVLGGAGVRLADRHVLVAGTSPADGTENGRESSSGRDWEKALATFNLPTVIGFDVNRNAAFHQPQRLRQRHSAVDFVAILVVRHRCFVAEVFGAKTFIAMSLRIHFLAFAVSSSLELACR